MVRWDAGAREYALSCDSVFPGMKITQTKRIGHALTLPEIDSALTIRPEAFHGGSPMHGKLRAVRLTPALARFAPW